MNMGRTLLSAIALAGVIAAPAHAIEFDFTNLNGGAEGLLPNSVSDNGVNATGWASDPSDVDSIHELREANLWLRNVTNDHGLGVCSEGAEECRTGGGNVNELDNDGLFEAIMLENTNGGVWAELWVSSLDGNQDGPIPEMGTVMWADEIKNFSHENAFSFAFGDFGSKVEGNILSLAAASGFDKSATFLLFFAGDFGQNFDDNDYLVWKGVVAVPAPGVVALLGLGLIGMGLARRRRA